MNFELKEPSVKSVVEPRRRMPLHIWIGAKQVSAYHCGAAEAIGIAQNELDLRKLNQ